MLERYIAALFVILLASGGAQAQISGSAALEAISRETRPRDESRVGAVDTGTGAFVYGMETLTVAGFRTTEFPLYYNSLLFGTLGELGQGWTHPYDMLIFPAGVSGPNVGDVFEVRYGLGRHNRFRYEGIDTAATPLDEAGRYDVLVRNTVSAGLADRTWTLRKPDGSIYNFNANGALTRHINAGGQELTIERSGGRISALNGSGKRLSLSYTSPGSRLVETVSDEASRVVRFVYGPGNRLLAIQGPALMDGEGNEYKQTNRASVRLSSTLTTIATFNVTRTQPADLVRFTTNILMSRPISFISGQVEGPVRVYLESPQGIRVELPGTTEDFESGTTRIMRWTGDVFFANEYAGVDPSGTWRALASVRSGQDNFAITDPTLRFSEPLDETRFAYDGSGRLTSATAPDGGQLFLNLYDAAGRIVMQDDGVATNKPAEFHYDERGNEIHTTYLDRLGNPWLFVHDNRYRLLRRTDPLDDTISFVYDSNGNRTRITDTLGRNTDFTYDSRGNLTTVSRYTESGRKIDVLSATYFSNGREIRAIRDALGKETTFENYNTGSNPSLVTDAAGNKDRRTYGGSGQLLNIQLADSAEIKYDYQNGLLVRTHHPHEPNTWIGTVFDAIGRMVSSTGTDGAGTTYSYNARLQLLRQSDPAGTVSSSFDRRGRQLSKQDRQGNVTTFQYDGNGNLITESTFEGSTRYEYDGEDRRIAETDPSGNTTRIEYDAAGRMISVTDPEGLITRFEHDDAGNVIAERDGQNRLLSRTVYDYRNLPVITIDALGNETRYTYDDAGRLTQIRDPLGRITTRRYDALDRLVEVRDALGRVARQEYTSDDRIERIYDHRTGQGTTPLVRFSYDKANRVSGMEYPTSSFSLRYTKADQVQEERSTSGRVRSYVYDDKGNLTTVRASMLSGTSTIQMPEVLNEYDPEGNLTRVRTRDGGRLTEGLIRSYDTSNRITRFTDAGGNTLRYTYDEAGNLARLVYPDNKTVRYSYDKKGRITEIRDWADRITRYTWGVDGITRIEFPNGTTRTMQYDQGGRIVRRQDRSAQGAVILDYFYSYDAAGQITVESSTRPSGTVNFTPATMTYDQENRLTAFNGSPVTFDRDGNMTRGPVRASLANFNYDAKNNLISAGSVTYTYDPEDRLIAFGSSNSVTKLVVNPAPEISQVLIRTAPNGAVTRYIWGAGLVYEENADGVRVYHQDERGNVVAFTDSTGSVTGTVSYGPFGNIMSRTGNAESLFLFGGLFGVLTDTNGLAYMRYRWYSPEIHRFINQDAHFGSITDPGSLNRYSYAGNNPITRADPKGEFWHILAGAAIGAVAAVVVQAASDVISGEFSGFEKYGAVALGGAVAGGIAAACGGIFCSGLAGAAGAFVTNVAEKGFRGQEVNWEEAGQEAAFGFGSGLLGGAAGKAFGKIAGVQKWTLKEAFEQAPAVLPRAYANTVIRRTIAREFVKRLGAQVAGLAKNELFALLAPASASTAPRINATAKYTIEGRARMDLNAEKIGVYGEHVHWRRYLDSLRMANRPLPANPNNILAVF